MCKTCGLIRISISIVLMPPRIRIGIKNDSHPQHWFGGIQHVINIKRSSKNLQGSGGTVACIWPADPLLPSLGHLAAVHGNGNAHALTRQEQLVAHDEEAVIAVEHLCPGPTKRVKLNISQNKGREFCYFWQNIVPQNYLFCFKFCRSGFGCFWASWIQIR